jgi:hypothetical protein
VPRAQPSLNPLATIDHQKSNYVYVNPHAGSSILQLLNYVE